MFSLNLQLFWGSDFPIVKLSKLKFNFSVFVPMFLLFQSNFPKKKVWKKLIETIVGTNM